MALDRTACYRALKARDARFDGLFFVGVESTGIYCRPICPARTPARARCRFFDHAAAAERAGFRACLRCRPELAPGRARVDARPRLVTEALGRIEAGFLDEHGVDELAGELGVTARHLRRTLERELGVSPRELAQTRRLALAKQLLHDTHLPLAQVAFAAGFSSVRRFNAAVRERFGAPPSHLRRSTRAGDRSTLRLRLDYRPPLDWGAALEFLGARAIPQMEQVEAGSFRRTLALAGRVGWVELRPDPRAPRLLCTLSLGLAGVAARVVAGLRALFDLDAEPAQIDEQLANDPALAPRVRARPGLRVTGAVDPFELAVRAVIGQQVSVAAARTLAGRLVARLGPVLDDGPPGLARCFPAAEILAAAGPGQLRELGLTRARAETLHELASSVASGRLSLRGDPSEVVDQLLELPGVGPWTAQIIAMRALRWPDAFPAGDLVLRRALACDGARACERRAEAWRPWRAYAAMHLWMKPGAAPETTLEQTPA